MEHFCICSRLYRFEASHYERLPIRFRIIEDDFKVYGNSVMPHGHNYELQINLAGEVDRKTGMVMELGKLDKTVMTLVDELDHRNLSNVKKFRSHENAVTQEFIIMETDRFLRNELSIPYLQSISLSESNGESKMTIHKENKMTVYHTKEFTFNAQHSLSCAALNPIENKLAFGKCINAHGHDYILRVTIMGAPNETTNKLLVEHHFERSINEYLTYFDYSDLNSLKEFTSYRPPTTENLIETIYNGVEGIIQKLQQNKYASDNVKLAYLELQETNRNRFLYFGDNYPLQATVEVSGL